MTRDDYNAKVQELQAMWGIGNNHVRAHRKGDRITESSFEVYWDGSWHQLGTQHQPFTPETSYEWNETMEFRLRGELAAALIHS